MNCRATITRAIRDFHGRKLGHLCDLRRPQFALACPTCGGPPIFAPSYSGRQRLVYISQQRQNHGHGSEEPTAAELIDSAIAEVALAERRPSMVIEDPSSLDEYLVDQLFEEEPDLLSQYDGFVDDL